MEHEKTSREYLGAVNKDVLIFVILFEGSRA